MDKKFILMLIFWFFIGISLPIVLSKIGIPLHKIWKPSFVFDRNFDCNSCLNNWNDKCQELCVCERYDIEEIKCMVKDKINLDYGNHKLNVEIEPHGDRCYNILQTQLEISMGKPKDVDIDRITRDEITYRVCRSYKMKGD